MNQEISKERRALNVYKFGLDWEELNKVDLRGEIDSCIRNETVRFLNLLNYVMTEEGKSPAFRAIDWTKLKDERKLPLSEGITVQTLTQEFSNLLFLRRQSAICRNVADDFPLVGLTLDEIESYDGCFEQILETHFFSVVSGEYAKSIARFMGPQAEKIWQIATDLTAPFRIYQGVGSEILKIRKSQKESIRDPFYPWVLREAKGMGIDCPGPYLPLAMSLRLALYNYETEYSLSWKDSGRFIRGARIGSLLFYDDLFKEEPRGEIPPFQIKWLDSWNKVSFVIRWLPSGIVPNKSGVLWVDF